MYLVCMLCDMYSIAIYFEEVVALQAAAQGPPASKQEQGGRG